MYIIYKPSGDFDVLDSYQEATQKYGRLPYNGLLVFHIDGSLSTDQIISALEKKKCPPITKKKRKRLKETIHVYQSRREEVPIQERDCKEDAAPPLNLLAAYQKEKPSLLKETAPITKEHEPTISAPPKEVSLPAATYLCLPHTVTMYTDGSCLEGKFGGFAAVILDGSRPIAFLSDSAMVTGSQEAEWQAVLLALRALSERHHEVYLYTDFSQIALAVQDSSAYGKLHKAPAMQKILTEILDILQNQHVVIAHIKGHQGHLWNETADVLAKQRSSELREAYLAAYSQNHIPVDDAPKELDEMIQKCLG